MKFNPQPASTSGSHNVRKLSPWILAFATLLLHLQLAISVQGQTGVKLEALPTTAKIFPNRKTPVLVVVRNPTANPLNNLTLSWYSDAIVDVTGDGLKLSSLPANAEHAWTIQVGSTANGEFAPGSLHFRLDYSNGNETPGVLLTSVEVQSGAVQNSADIADVKIESTLESLTQQTPGKVYIVVTNKINKRLTATITPTWPYGLESTTNQSSYVIDLQPYQTAAVEVGVKAKDRVRPGKHLLIFDATLAWDESGQPQVRHNIVTRPVDVGVLGESQILTLIGVPSFLLLPGFLVLLTVKIAWSLKWFKVKGQPTAFPWDVKSAEFAFAAITISFLLTGSYSWLWQNLFDGYGLRDIIIVWFLSVFVIGFLGYVLVAFVYRWRWRRVTPSVDDEPIPFLQKLARRRLGLVLDRAQFKIKVNGQDTDQEAFLLESTENAGDTIWVAPPITIRWPDEADENLKQSVRNQLEEGNPKALAALLEAAAGDGIQNNARPIVSWAQLGTLNRPTELKTSDFVQIVAQTRLVNEDEGL